MTEALVERTLFDSSADEGAAAAPKRRAVRAAPVFPNSVDVPLTANTKIKMKVPRRRDADIMVHADADNVESLFAWLAFQDLTSNDESRKAGREKKRPKAASTGRGAKRQAPVPGPNPEAGEEAKEDEGEDAD